MQDAPPVHIVAWFPSVSHLSQRQKLHCLSVGMTSMPNLRRVAVDHSRAGIFQFLCFRGGKVTQWWPGPECASTCEASCSVRVFFMVSHLFLSHHCAIDSRWPSSDRSPVTAPDFRILATISAASWPEPAWSVIHSPTSCRATLATSQPGTISSMGEAFLAMEVR